MKRVAVVILNWNGKNFLERFLPSVLRSCNLALADVIVADNGSTDSSKSVFTDVLKSENSSFTLEENWIQLDKNYGFTGGYNRAFQKLKREYEYYILLNSDVFTPSGWLEPLISFMDGKPEVAVCQPKILAFGTNKFEYAGASGGFIDFFGFPFCRGRILSEIEEDSGQYDSPARTFWASGACMVVRSAVWRELSGLDESFFAHMEEIDFCWRAALLGYQVWCEPKSSIYHVGGGTLPNSSPSKLFYNYRNNLLMLRKNLPKKRVSCMLFLRKRIDELSAIAFCMQFKFDFAKAVWRAHKEYNRLKRDVKSSPRVKEETPYGIYKRSIICDFFTGRKMYGRLKIRKLTNGCN